MLLLQYLFLFLHILGHYLMVGQFVCFLNGGGGGVTLPLSVSAVPGEHFFGAGQFFGGVCVGGSGGEGGVVTLLQYLYLFLHILGHFLGVGQFFGVGVPVFLHGGAMLDDVVPGEHAASPPNLLLQHTVSRKVPPV